MADFQTLFNLAAMAVGALFGWWFKVIWDAIKDLQQVDRDLAEKVSSIEVLVAGKYITRDEFNTTVNLLFSKLDNIKDIVIGLKQG